MRDFPNKGMVLSSHVIGEEWVEFMNKIGTHSFANSFGLMRRVLNFCVNIILMHASSQSFNILIVKTSLSEFNEIVSINCDLIGLGSGISTRHWEGTYFQELQSTTMHRLLRDGWFTILNFKEKDENCDFDLSTSQLLNEVDRIIFDASDMTPMESKNSAPR